MARKQYDLDEVLRALHKKNDVKITPNSTVIQVLRGPSAKSDLGNGSWGKIDFLTNHCGYQKVFVPKYS